MTDDIRKLLGGYATGTLTQEERQKLYAAALQDQTLFEALADEQALKELLEDGAARAQLLHAAETEQFSIRGTLREWFDLPKSKVLVGLGAALLLAIGVREIGQLVREEPQTVAMLREAAPAVPPVAPPAAPAPTPRAEKRKAAVAPTVENKAATVMMDRAEIAAAPPAAQVAVAQDTATRVLSSGDLEFKYTVLLRDAKGDYSPVPADYLFAAGDRARVRVEVNQEGIVALTGNDGKPLYVRNVPAAAPTILPHEIAFDDPGDQHLELAFLKTTALPVAGAAPIMEFSAREQAGSSQAKAMRSSATAAPRPVVSVNLHLRRKP